MTMSAPTILNQLPWIARLASAWLIGVFLLIPAQRLRAAESRPNVVVVMTDDQGYADLACHGHPVLKTPHLDRLYAESIRLTDFHVCPMCTPTRGQFLTGVDCLRNGAMNVSSGRTLLRREFPTLGNLFSAGGYRTGVFGKWHVGDNYPFRPQDRGFHESVWYPSSHIGSAPDYWTNAYFDDVYWHNGRREKFHGYTTDVFFDEAIRWMGHCQERREPFVCYVPTAAAHGPLFVPEKYRRMYDGQKENVARFFGMISNIDDNMGRLEAFLKDSGLRDNTIVIFLTDNGGTAGVPVFNAGMRGQKITLYEGGHRVPCFIRWPNGMLRPPGNVSGLTTVQDLLPTLLDLCRLNLADTGGNSTSKEKTVSPKFDGINLANVLRGNVQPLEDRTLVLQFSRMQAPVPVHGDACVLWKRWRLVENKELFDLATDPGQQRNVIDQHSELAAKLRADYDRWWSGVVPRINEHAAITIGSDAENPTQLSPADWEDSFLDQGRQVRDGLRRNGSWNLFVDRAGDYVFELRRWPREADAAFTAALPELKHRDGQFPAGTALPVAKIRLQIGELEMVREISPSDKFVTITTSLPVGRTQLRTTLLDADGQELAGAYFAYVTRTSS
jgi:arylsulfatase A-like enzyme